MVDDITDCAECESRRFKARGAIWCPTCDKQTPETLAQRTEVKK